MKFFILIIAVALSGCDRPNHIVIDPGKMKVYAAKEKSNKKNGSFEYWVRDGSTRGWTLISDKEFKVGDTLEIVKAEAK